MIKDVLTKEVAEWKLAWNHYFDDASFVAADD